MDFAFAAVDVIRKEEPELFDLDLSQRITTIMQEAVQVETAFAEDVLVEGLSALSLANIRHYLEYVADQRLVRLGIEKHYGAKNPLDFMTLQDVAEHTNFFERIVSAIRSESMARSHSTRRSDLKRSSAASSHLHCTEPEPHYLCC